MLVEIMRPEVDVPLRRTGAFVGPYPSGAPAIFIDAIAKLGIGAGIVGCVGDDDFGLCVRERLSSDGVDVSQVRVCKDKTTAVAFVNYFASGDREFLFHVADAAAGQIRADQLKREWLHAETVLHLNGSSIAINEAVRQICYEAARLVKECGGTVTLDPNVRPELFTRGEMERLYGPLLSYCDYVIPSRGEAEWMTSSETLDDAAGQLFELGVKAVVCKRGADGCVLYTPDFRLESSAFDVQVVDPTGAGDCFSAGLVYGLLRKWEWPTILTFANAMGALATCKQGPMEGTISLSEVVEFIRKHGVELAHG